MFRRRDGRSDQLCVLRELIFNLIAASPLHISKLSSRLQPIMRFVSLLSSQLRLDIHTHSLQALEYFFMLTLPLSYQNNVRAASFVGIDRPPAGASGGSLISLKKVLDVVVATIAIAVVAPLMLTVALAIKRESPGPIIFRRKRIGLNGSIFEIWKSRSMYAEHPDLDAPRQSSTGDPRVTRVGCVIRRSRIDGLPQLLNVILGRMSAAGQRSSGHPGGSATSRGASRGLRRPPAR